jgi:hypothetical protein
MSTNALHDHESTDTELDDRTERAVTECMGVLHEGGDIYTVVGENAGGEYRVDTREGRCTCPDHQHRGAECKHQRRCKFALGHEPVPAAFSPADVPGQLGGKHLDGEPEFLATDGGVPDHVTEVSAFGESDGFVRCDRCGATGDTVDEVDHHGECPTVATDGGVVDTMADTEAGERVRVPVSGGVLVYESRALGKELVGFENVDDWDALADALAAKGHDRGGVFHLPVLDDDSSDDDGRDGATRSEPADFGHGESTGVREL